MENNSVPDSIPNACPGTQSEKAGKVNACEGCPNQKVCASGEPQPEDPAIQAIKERLSGVRHKMLVLSGKGGVGKSTMACQLAYMLAGHDRSKHVGVLDIDICGPSIPVMMGIEGHQIHQSSSGWSPVLVEENISVMTIGLMLDGPDAAVIWRGPKKNGMIKQFLMDVDWGQLEYMLIDTPPGTSDEHLTIAQLLQGAGIDGALIITTPHELSLVDVRKEINFCKKVGIPIMGVVENMTAFVCPKCSKESVIFPASPLGSVEQMCAEMTCTYLGSVPLDPRIARCCDEGETFYCKHPESPAVKKLNIIKQKIIDYCDGAQLGNNN